MCASATVAKFSNRTTPSSIGDLFTCSENCSTVSLIPRYNTGLGVKNTNKMLLVNQDSAYLFLFRGARHVPASSSRPSRFATHRFSYVGSTSATGSQSCRKGGAGFSWNSHRRRLLPGTAKSFITAWTPSMRPYNNLIPPGNNFNVSLP